MCRVSVAEFRNNLNYYLGLCLKEEVFITKHGKVVAVLSNPDNKYYQTLLKLYGCLKNADLNKIIFIEESKLF